MVYNMSVTTTKEKQREFDRMVKFSGAPSRAFVMRKLMEGWVSGKFNIAECFNTKVGLTARRSSYADGRVIQRD